MAKNRKQKIIQAAEQLIASKGFEGMRTREVAELAGVNHATIHYHFKDKERLIEAVVHSLVQQMYESDTAGLSESGLNGREKLAAVFQRNIEQRKQYPERFAIMAELTLRASRHPKIEKILIELDQKIFGQMRELIQNGVDSGDLPAKLNVHTVAVLLITLLRGIHGQPGEVETDQLMEAYALIDESILTH